jgi:hypothetical protein
MLQKYKFIDNHNVQELQKDIIAFFQKIKGAIATDNFDSDTYLPTTLAKKAKRKVTKTIRGRAVQVDNNLFKKTKAFFDQYKTLVGLQNIVDDAFTKMNRVTFMLDNAQPRVCITDLPVAIQQVSKSLFVYLYEDILPTYGVKKHYKDFCQEQDNTWCPFCGMESLEDYTHIKEDYDHLLAKSIYPFAAINMRNLAPIGKKCNRTHKRDKDLIWDGVNQIKAINPYAWKLDIELDFDGTILPSSSNRKGTWNLKLLPDREEVTRWDFVYNISDRIIKDYFTRGKRPDFETWLTDFIYSHEGNEDLTTIKKVRDALEKYGRNLEVERYKEGRYVKASVFKWISRKADDTYIQAVLDSIQNTKVA